MLIKTTDTKAEISPADQTIDIGEDESNNDKGPTFGKRHLQVIYLLFLITIGTTTGSNLSETVAAIANITSENPDIPSFDWETESVILSSFYWGTVILQVFAGQLGITYGPKYLLAGAMFLNATACMLIPLIASYFGPTGVIACRITQGLAQGFFYPSAHNLLGQWVPATERSRLCLLAYSGTPASAIIYKLASSYISQSWTGCLVKIYVFGGFGYAWIILWVLYGSNSPAEHGTITEIERKYIQKSLGVKVKSQITKTPWAAIFTSLPVWAIVIAFLGQTWGASILLNETPRYIEKVMQYDMKSNRLLLVAPNIAVIVLSFVFCFISDYLINVKYVPRTMARKIFTTIGMTVPLIGLIPQGFLPEDTIALSLILLMIAVSSSAATCSGSFANIMDLSPKYSGIIMGITNCSANFFSIGSPFIIHVIVNDQADKYLWTTIFIIASCFYSAANIFYVIFASCELQWWHSSGEESNIQHKEPEKSQKIFNIDIRDVH